MSYPFTTPGSVPAINWADDNFSQTQQGINQIATLQPQAQLPSWLTTNPDSLLQELSAQYARVPSMMSSAGISKAYDTAIGTTKGMGGQIANNAAREEVARGGISGGQVNSAMVKAQAMLPVYSTTSKLETDKAAAVAQQQNAQMSMMSQIAAHMGQLRTSYLSNLGQIQSMRQGTTDSWITSQEGQRQSQLNSERDYQLQLQKLAMMQSSAGQQGPPGGFTGQMTRAMNDGGGVTGMEFTPQFKQFLSQSPTGTNYMKGGAPQYPQQTGLLAGGALDNYDAQMRLMGSMANGGPAYNQQVIDEQNLFPAKGWSGDPKYDVTTGKYNNQPVYRNA